MNENQIKVSRKYLLNKLENNEVELLEYSTIYSYSLMMGFPCGSAGKESTCHV